MTFPGAETIKAGIIGDDCFRSRAILFLCFTGPLSWVFARSSVKPLTDALVGAIAEEGDVEGLESDGVSSWAEVVVLELDRRE